MQSFSQTKNINYSAKNMFDLVMDIEKYPQFLPWCKDAKITQHIFDDNIHADLLINFKNIFETYTSDIKFKETQNDYYIHVVAIKGPFRHLVNNWHFSTISDNSCKINFDVEFEFSSKILTKLIGVIFKEASKKMMKAFENRANQIYKKNV